MHLINHMYLCLFQVAIKIIDIEQGKKDYVMKNLTREAKVLSMLRHPNIVRLYETIRVSEKYFRVQSSLQNFDRSIKSLYPH